MKITAPLLALAFASAVTANDQSTCAINHPHVANAIGKFCQNQNMVIPVRLPISAFPPSPPLLPHPY